LQQFAETDPLYTTDAPTVYKILLQCTTCLLRTVYNSVYSVQLNPPRQLRHCGVGLPLVSGSAGCWVQ